MKFAQRIDFPVRPVHIGCFAVNNIYEVIFTAKKGMKRIDRAHTKPRNEEPPVPEIQGKAKHGKAEAGPIIAGTQPPSQKVYHSVPHHEAKQKRSVYSVIDNDLARDNLENNISKADLEDM